MLEELLVSIIGLFARLEFVKVSLDAHDTVFAKIFSKVHKRATCKKITVLVISLNTDVICFSVIGVFAKGSVLDS